MIQDVALGWWVQIQMRYLSGSATDTDFYGPLSATKKLYRASGTAYIRAHCQLFVIDGV